MTDSKKTTALISNNKVYDVLKYIAQIFLPALGTLYFGIAQAWGLANGTAVVGTIVAVDTFLGLLLHLSNIQYNNSEAKYAGTMDIYETEDKKTFSLNLEGDPNDLDKRDEVTFKVNKQNLV